MNPSPLLSPFGGSSTGSAPAATGGEIVPSLTYSESLTPYYPPAPTGTGSAGTLLGHAPDLLRATAGGAWALVLITGAGGLVVLLVLLTVRVAGWLA